MDNIDYSFEKASILLPGFIYLCLLILGMLSSDGKLARLIFFGISSVITVPILIFVFTYERTWRNPPIGEEIFGAMLPLILFHACFFALVKAKIIAREDDQKAELQAKAIEASKTPGQIALEALAKAEQIKLWNEETAQRSFGKIVKTLKCPHCDTKGFVRRLETTRVDKARVNSLPGAVIGLGTNTTRNVTQMRCDNCETKWDV